MSVQMLSHIHMCARARPRPRSNLRPRPRPYRANACVYMASLICMRGCTVCMCATLPVCMYACNIVSLHVCYIRMRAILYVCNRACAPGAQNARARAHLAPGQQSNEREFPRSGGEPRARHASACARAPRPGRSSRRPRTHGVRTGVVYILCACESCYAHVVSCCAPGRAHCVLRAARA